MIENEFIHTFGGHFEALDELFSSAPSRISDSITRKRYESFLSTGFHDLTKTLRSHIAENVALWVEKLIGGDIRCANKLSIKIREQGFELYITRDLDQAKSYVTGRYEGQNEKRFGLIASARDKILPAFGVDNDYMTTVMNPPT